MTPAEIANAAMHAGAAQKIAEFEQLVAVVLEQRPAVVVEIGTMSGGTLGAWCSCAADDALIISIDLPDGEWGGGYQEHDVPRLNGYAQRGQRLELVRGDSHADNIYLLVSSLLEGQEIDFLFIDGDHTYEGVSADYMAYTSFVRSGGLIAFHDILPHPQVPRCRVSDFWAELKVQFEKHGDGDRLREFTVDGDERTWGPWGGIGVLEWPG